MKKAFILILMITLLCLTTLTTYANSNLDSHRLIPPELLLESMIGLDDQVIQVSLGKSHSAALTKNGKVYTWGLNNNGQLGNGTYHDSYFPVDITAGLPVDDKVIQISLGTAHTAALTESGALYTWGQGNKGQLGLNSSGGANTPRKIMDRFPTNDQIIQISMGGYHSSALTESGKVFTWGDGESGQLGRGNYYISLIPVDITHKFPIEDKVVYISMGADHSSALSEQGKVFMWGSNGAGQIGNNSIEFATEPVNITPNFPIEEQVSQLAINGYHSSVLMESGKVFTWGGNSFGQLGDGTNSNKRLPTEITNNVPVGEKIVQLALGEIHTSMLSDSGKIFTFGRNNYGQLGNNTTIESWLPVEVMYTPSIEDQIVQLSNGGYHSSFRTESGKIFIWGWSGFGLLGLGNQIPYSVLTPTELTLLSPPQMNRIFFESNGGSHVDDIVAPEGQNITSPLPPSKAGFFFSGWYSDIDLTNPYIFNKMPATNITLYAKWFRMNYSIIYNLNGGLNDVNNPTTFHIETPTITLADPTKENYTFEGWFSNPTFTGSVVSEIEVGSYGNINLYAKWTATPYSITYVLNGGINHTNNLENYTIESAAILLEEPARVHYLFAGWYTTPTFDEGTEISEIPTNSTGNVTIYAKWIFHPYQVTFNTNGGSDILDYSFTGTSGLPYYAKHDVSTSADGAVFVYAIDLDGDGHIDILSSNYLEDSIAWYKNDGNGNFTEHIISSVAYGSYSLYVIDVDGDGDLDIMSANSGNKTIIWYENDGNENFTEHVIDNTGNDPVSITAIDLDGDGDIDILATYSGSNIIVWYENDGIQNFTRHVIASTTPGVYSVIVKDIDGDGDLDVIVALYSENTVAWYENDGNQNFTKHVVTSTASGVFAIYAIDIDGDGDIDIISAHYGSNTVEWHENDGNGNFISHVVSTSAIGTYFVFAIDLDSDGDIDIISANSGNNTIEWFENDGNQNFTKHVVTTVTDFPASVFAIDLDGDGEIDIISASFNDNTIAWFKANSLLNVKLIEPNNPIKEGHTFSDWYIDSGLTQVYDFDTEVTEDFMLYAKWDVNQYTITFDSNGGSAVSAITEDYNTAITAPSDPTRVGYTFTGWSQAVPLNMPAEHLTLTAEWSINQYTITFDSNGGSAVSTITQDYDSVVITPSDPTRVGYTFTGWSQIVPLNMPAEHLTLIAEWSINQYTITFNSNGGSVVPAITEDYNTAITAPSDPTRVGYTFTGWSQVVPLNMPAENLTLTAVWNVINFDIFYTLNGGNHNETNPDTYHIETPTITLAEPTKLGFTFKGWYEQTDFTGSEITEITLGSTGNKTLYAKWDVNQYTITFDSNGGSAVSAITQDYDSVVIAPSDPTRVGYTFTGWSQVVPLNMPAENLTLTAVWNVINFDIFYTLNGGNHNETNPDTYHIETPTITLAEPTKLGFTFKGWYEQTDFTGSEITEITLGSTGNKTLYAKWDVNQYTITFDSNGGSAVSAITQDYDSVVIAPSDPTRVGYTFTGWSQVVPLNMPAEHLTLIAEWSINQYTITFDSNGGSAVSAITQDYDSVVIAPSDPTRVGYTFTGWSQVVPLNMPAENLTLTAVWNVINFDIFYTLNGGNHNETNPDTYHIETPTITLAEPTKLGFTFKGWYEQTDFTGSEITEITLGSTGNKTLYAKWDVNQYTITFDSNGGSAVSAITQDYDSVVIAPSDPTRVGYTFTGWSQIVPLNMPAEHLTLTAEWSINQYTITFDSNGGSAVSAITEDYNTAITDPSDPTREGYVFNGYSIPIPSIMPAENLTIHVFWLKLSTESQIQTEVEGLLDAIDNTLTRSKNVEVVVVVDIVEEEQAYEQDVELIKEQLKRNQNATFINIQVLLQEEGQDDILINILNQAVKITIEIPEVDRGYKNYRVIRVHQDELSILDTIYDEETNTLTFETDRFSTYAIVYDVSNLNMSTCWWLLLLLIPLGLIIFFIVFAKRSKEEEKEEVIEETETVIELSEVILPNIDERPKYKAFEKVENGDYLEITSKQEASNRVVEVNTGVLPKLINQDNSFIPLKKDEIKQFKIIPVNLKMFKKLTPGSYTEEGYFVEVDLNNRQVENYNYTKKRLPPTTTKGHRWVRIQTRRIKSE
jgi:uncharacterized repeat protein (TIGR02543 family)